MKACRMIAAAGLATGILGASALWAGDLNPPPGPITPTMKSLDSIRPGVCVNDLPGSASAVHVIRQPGVYYLRDAIQGQSGKHGILIDFSALPPGAHEVTIDMGGHSIQGVSGSLDGVHSSSFENGRYVMRAGAPLRSPLSSITGFDGDGLHIEGASSVCVDGLRFDSNGGDGFEIEYSSSGSPQTLRCSGVVSYGSGGSGGRVVVRAAQSSSLSFEDVTCADNVSDGLRVEWAQSAGPGRRASMDSSRCVMTGNGGHGIYIDGTHRQSADMSMDADGLACSENGGSGFAVVESVGLSSYSFDACTFSDNSLHGADLRGGGGGHHPNVVHFVGCAMSENGQHGVVHSSRQASFDSCRAFDNNGDGFLDILTSGPTPSNAIVSYSTCVSSRNGGDGFRAIDTSGDPDREHSISYDFCESSENIGAGYRCQDVRRASMDSSSSTRNGGGGVSQSHMTLPGHKLHLSSFQCAGNLGTGLSMDGGELSMDSCDFSENGFGVADGDGIRVTNSPSVHISSSSSSGNFRNGGTITVSGTLVVSGGSFVSNGAGPVGGFGLSVQDVQSVRCEDTSCRANAGTGIWIADTNNTRVLRCSSSGNSGGGLVIDNTLGLPCGVVEVEDSSFTHNAGDGALLTCSTGGVVTRCVSAQNTGDGLVVSGFGHVVTANSCVGNGGSSFIVSMPGNSMGPITTEQGMATAPCTANFER